MKRRLLLLVIILFLFAAYASWGYSTADGPGTSNNSIGLIQGETIMIFPDTASFEKAVWSGQFQGARVINSYSPLRMLRLEFPYRDAASDTPFNRECQKAGAAISPNFTRKAHLIPDDPKFGSQTYLEPIGASEAWDLFNGDSSLVVAVIDTGIARDHPDLQANVIGGANLRESEDISDYNDLHGHGTAVSGIIGATTNNNTGIAGICWHVRILAVKVLGGEDLTTTLFEEAAGIDYAVSHGAKVINMSFGGPGTSSVEQNAINKAVKAGVILVASAGNDGVYGDRQTAPDGLNYPAAFPDVIGVGALTNTLVRADFSNFGFDQCELAAVGKSVYTTLPGGLGDLIGPILSGRSYGWATGTSFAAPQVTALAALLRMKEPWLGPEQLKTRLRENAQDLGGPDNDGDGVDDNLGYGMIKCFDTLADSPVSRNEAFKVGVFPSPVFPERLYIYVQVLKPIDAGSLSITGLPDGAPPMAAEVAATGDGNFIGNIYWPVGFGPLKIEIIASHGGEVYPEMLVTYIP